MKELFIFTSKADTTGYRTLTGCKEMMPACFCFLEQSTLATETGGHLQTSIAECQANEAEPKSFEYTVYMHVLFGDFVVLVLFGVHPTTFVR